MKAKATAPKKKATEKKATMKSTAKKIVFSESESEEEEVESEEDEESEEEEEEGPAPKKKKMSEEVKEKIEKIQLYVEENDVGDAKKMSRAMDKLNELKADPNTIEKCLEHLLLATSLSNFLSGEDKINITVCCGSFCSNMQLTVKPVKSKRRKE